MLLVAQVVPDETGGDGDRSVGYRALQLGDGRLLFRLDGGARLLDHGSGFDLGLLGDVGLRRIAGALRLGNDLRSLAFRFLELPLVLLERPLAFDTRLLGLLEGILDGLLALLQHAVE